MAIKQINHSKHCYACGLEQGKPSLGYDIKTMKTYCMDVKRCGSSMHPNAHGKKVDLVPLMSYAGFMAEIKKAFNKNIYLAFERMIGKTISFRTSTTVINYILRYSQEHRCTSLNHTLVTILEEHMKQNPLDHVELEYCDWELNRKRKFHTRPEPEATPEEWVEKKLQEEPDPVPVAEEVLNNPETKEYVSFEEVKATIGKPEPVAVVEDDEDEWVI